MVGATHPAGIAMDYVNVHHHGPYLQAAYWAIVAIVGDKESQSVLISSLSVSCTREIVAAFSK